MDIVSLAIGFVGGCIATVFIPRIGKVIRWIYRKIRSK